ncbi:helix-turn-helix domain-containing protein [Bacterioplanoides sp.]|uniref:helix-turn-helix domain-containing protein n=1 Tax=Bacterioplanoides sp. TaxID=2066072 RepID=UPI003B5A997C
MANHYLNAVTACPLKGTVKSIAVALANRANNNGVSWPSVKTLSADTGFHISTVKRAIQSLKGSGHLKVDARSRKDGSQTSNRYTLIIESFTTGVKQAIKKGFVKAVEMGQQFVESKVRVIKPTSSRIGEQACLELSEVNQQVVIDRLTSKTNHVLKSQIENYGLDSAYVQKVLFNEVQQFRREKSVREYRTTIEKLTDRSWDIETATSLVV